MKNKGFTMIELIVAIAIMGVLMIIALPTVNYIQNNNRNTKFKAYEKAVSSSSRLYTDQYNDDMFGSRNTGCAIIRYEDLKDRDLIEDIQIKDTTCDNTKIKSTDYNNYTYVIVRKSKNGNLNYEPTVSCRTKASEVLYGTPNNKNLEDDCKLEDGEGPEYDVRDTSGKGPPTYKSYYYDDVMNIKVTIKDTGVGLMEGQTLNYRWFKNKVAITSFTTINFNNKNYEGSKTKSILTPGDISKPTETTTYTLHVNGTLEDVDGNTTEIDKYYDFVYFVGTAHIRFIANGGVMARNHDPNLSLGADQYVYTTGNVKAEQTVRYNQSLGEKGLWNYNEPTWINLERTGYHIDSKKEWKDQYGNIYDQSYQYAASKFCTNLRTNNCDINLSANWIINTYTLTYNNNGGSGCSSITKKYGEKWGTLCTPTKSGYVFTGWTTSPSINANSTVTSNVTATANWKTNTYTLTYNNNGGSGCSSITKNAGEKWGTLCTPTRTGYSFTGWTTTPSINANSTATSNVTATANWKANVCTITYSPNGGKFTSNANDVVQKVEYGKKIGSADNGMRNCNGGYYSAKNSYFKIKSKAEWIKGSTTYNEDKQYNATDICPKLGSQDQSVTLKVNWYYNNCESGNTKWHQTINDNTLKKIKNNGGSAEGIANVSTYHWDYDSRSCGGSLKRRYYKFKHLICACKIDKNTKAYCNDAEATNIVSISHNDSNQKAYITYVNNSNGESACKGDKNVNSYVDEVCTNGVFGKHSMIIFHGYYFYRGKVGEHNNFSPSSYWTHNGKDYENRVVASSSNKAACKHACKFHSFNNS